MFIYGTTAGLSGCPATGRLAEGELFTDRDVRNGSKVCLLGQTMVRELFQDESPIGKEIRVKNVRFKVVGVLARKGANMMGMDQDDILLAPWTTIKYRVSGTRRLTTATRAPAAAPPTVPRDSVNTLSNLYPSGQTSLYPDPFEQRRLPTTPLPVRFTNVDQIHGARPGQPRRFPRPSSKSPTCCASAIAFAARRCRTTSPCAT